MPHYRKKKRIPTELTWEDKNPRNYHFKPSKAFARVENMDKSWISADRSSVRPTGLASRRSGTIGHVRRRGASSRTRNKEEPRRLGGHSS